MAVLKLGKSVDVEKCTVWAGRAVQVGADMVARFALVSAPAALRSVRSETAPVCVCVCAAATEVPQSVGACLPLDPAPSLFLLFFLLAFDRLACVHLLFKK